MTVFAFKAVRPMAVSFSLLTFALLLPPLASAAEPKSAVDETQKTEQAVLAVDEHWLRAELGGDVAYLNQLLLPEYRSVSPVGVAHAKAHILAHAERNRGKPEEMKQYEDYLKSPPGHSVVIDGDLAILSYYDLKLGPQNGVMSSDVFVYRDGHWRAVYSQHSNAGKH